MTFPRGFCCCSIYECAAVLPYTGIDTYILVFFGKPDDGRDPLCSGGGLENILIQWGIELATFEYFEISC